MYAEAVIETRSGNRNQFIIYNPTVKCHIPSAPVEEVSTKSLSNMFRPSAWVSVEKSAFMWSSGDLI